MAARLAGSENVLLLERGRRWSAGAFPRGLSGLAGAYMSRRNPAGLWSMRLGRGTGNAFANAYGGSSVVNYGITARPEDHVFDRWPITAADMRPYFDRAYDVLRPSSNPNAEFLGDKHFLDLVEPGRRVDLENTIDWERCDDCGNCVPGCNAGAKRSLDQSYLRMAEALGASVRLGTDVRAIARREEGWAVRVRSLSTGRVETIMARRVVLAAGTLGTLDILWRSRAHVPVGRRFGHGMSMNGDGLAFLYDTSHQLMSHTGVPISTSVRLPFVGPNGERRSLMVMSGRVPMAAMHFAGAALAVCAEGIRESKQEERAKRWCRRLADLAAVRANGALAHSFMFKLDGEDGASGIARFTQGGVVIDWRGYLDDPVMRFAAERLRLWSARVGGTVVGNVATLPGMRSFSVHPLGGCRMGESIEEGVVDDVGRVYRPRGGFHEGLRIADGSVLPSAMGVPPSLTIAAFGERVAESMRVEATST